MRLWRETRLLTRPSGRRPRQPRPRVRAQPAQRRLAGRRRARAQARRLVARQVRRPAGRDPDRRPQGRAAEARDVHERLRPLRARRGELLQARPGLRPRRARRGRLRHGAAAGAAGGGLAGHNGLRSIAQHLGTPDFLRLRVGVGRPGRGDQRRLADYVLADFEPHDDAERIVARAADAVETLDAEGLEAAQRAVNAKRS